MTGRTGPQQHLRAGPPPTRPDGTRHRPGPLRRRSRPATSSTAPPRHLMTVQGWGRFPITHALQMLMQGSTGKYHFSLAATTAAHRLRPELREQDQRAHEHRVGQATPNVKEVSDVEAGQAQRHTTSSPQGRHGVQRCTRTRQVARHQGIYPRLRGLLTGKEGYHSSQASALIAATTATSSSNKVPFQAPPRRTLRRDRGGRHL